MTNRALRRQRFIKANDGRRVDRAISREAILTRSYSRVRPLQLAARHHLVRLNRLDANGRIRVITAHDTARARKIRRMARPGRLRAEAYETAWDAARAAKIHARAEAIAQADAVVERFEQRNRGRLNRLFRTDAA